MKKPSFKYYFLAATVFFLVAARFYTYTGPGNRTITASVCKVELYECQWIPSKGIYNYHLVDDWSCSNESKPWQAYPASGPTCSAATVGAQYWDRNQNAGATTTYPPATISAVSNCATPGNSGWCRGGPQVNFTVNEPIPGETISMVEGTVNSGALQTFCNLNVASGSCAWLPSDGTSNVSAWAVSTWGDTSLKTALIAKVDQAPPSVSTSLSPNGANGWYVTTPTITLSASDATSGIQSASFDTGSNSFTPPADGIYNLTATALDVAGNSTTSNISIKLDTTPPGLSTLFVPLNPNGKNGWYKTLPTLTLSASDATSGVQSATFDLSGSDKFIPSSDGVFNLVATALDVAGNTTKKNSTVRVDTTPPTLLLPVSPDGANGWYITSPTLTLSASDATSGIQSAALGSGGSTVTISQDGVYTITASGEDRAGNTSNVSFVVKKDALPPTLDIPLSPDGDNGWYKTTPTITLSSSDATSGLDFATFDTIGSNSFTPPGDGIYTVSATAKDMAGNKTTRSATLKVDTAAPTISVPVSPSGANGWFTSPTLTFTLNASDAGSGVQYARFTDAGGATLVNDTTVSVTRDGVYTLQAVARDNAGNVKSLSLTVRKDALAPVPALSPWPPSGQAGWFTSIPTFTISGTDATSGVDKAFFTATNTNTFTPPADGIYPVTGTVTDLAGNSASADYLLKLDSLAPSLSVLVTPAAPDGANGWYRTLPDLALSASDATSGLDFARFDLPGYPNRFSPPGDGLYSLAAVAGDVAGNTSSQTIPLKVDTTAPVLSIPASPDGENGWFVSKPTITLHASDATSGIQSASFDTGSDSFTPPADGVYTLTATALDVAGNQAAMTKTVMVDTTPPSLVISVDNQPAASGWFSQPAQTSAAANDSGSGLANIEHRINNDGSWVRGSSATVTASGVNTIYYRATDRAGNHTIASRVLKVDTTPPQTTFDPNDVSLSVTNDVVTVTGSTTDIGSGIDAVQYSLDGGVTWFPLTGGDWSFDVSASAFTNGTLEVLVRAVDNVGNSSTQTLVLTIPITKPTANPPAEEPRPNNTGSVASLPAAARRLTQSAGGRIAVVVAAGLFAMFTLFCLVFLFAFLALSDPRPRAIRRLTETLRRLNQ